MNSIRKSYEVRRTIQWEWGGGAGKCDTTSYFMSLYMHHMLNKYLLIVLADEV